MFCLTHVHGFYPFLNFFFQRLTWFLASSSKPHLCSNSLTGKFRHLPVVENGEVIALLDITKCLYDAISRMEKAAEQGSAIAAAVEGVERQYGNNFSG